MNSLTHTHQDKARTPFLIQAFAQGKPYYSGERKQRVLGPDYAMLVRSPVSLWDNFLFVSPASTRDNMCYLMPVMEDSQAAKYARSQLHTCEREHLHVRVYMHGSACGKPAGWSRNRGHAPLFHQPYPWPLQVLRNHVMVRVGGGWDTLGHYLDKHDPCRCTSLCESLESPLPMLWVRRLEEGGRSDLQGKG